MASSLFSQLHHICIVVHDLDLAQAYYESLGVGPWTAFPLTAFTEVSIPLDEFHTLRYRYADLGGVQLQLCEPGEGATRQRAFLERHGSGVFHLGFTVPDVEAAETAGTALGLDILLRGRRPDASGFTYFDTPLAGVTLQVRSAPSAAAPTSRSRA